ncbi:MAG: divalent metal cation transporter, partial [Candidatus Binatia bacterium]
EVEEKIAQGTVDRIARAGATAADLKKALYDTAMGMFFGALMLYFVMLATAATLFNAGVTNIAIAADAARALAPVAGCGAEVLFALGIVGVGFIALPVMTVGAAYDLCQSFGWRHGLQKRVTDAKLFYGAILVITALAMSMNFLGINPMKALVAAGVVQGISSPPLMLLMMLITNNRKVMGSHVNGRAPNIFGWITTAMVFAASGALLLSYAV